MRGFLLDAEGAPVGVELHDAVPFRIFDEVAEHGRSAVARGSPAEDLLEAGAVEDVVAKGQRHPVWANEV
ncbi:MAG: hypothetical protein H6Q08_2217, partial [Acidobacteria bacterium]|nr:hypothetical protein [Acidobacteriota bacterium]